MFLALISGVRGGGRDRERDDDRDQQRERDDEDGRRTGARLHDELVEKMQTMALGEDDNNLLKRMGAMSLQRRPTFDLEVEHLGEKKIIPVYATLHIDDREDIKEATVKIHHADTDSPDYEDSGGLVIYHKSWFSIGYEEDSFEEDDFRNGWYITDDGNGAFSHTPVSVRQNNGWSTPGPIPQDYDALLKMYPDKFTHLSPDDRKLGSDINEVLKQLAGRLKLWSIYPLST